MIFYVFNKLKPLKDVINILTNLDILNILYNSKINYKERCRTFQVLLCAHCCIFHLISFILFIICEWSFTQQLVGEVEK